MPPQRSPLKHLRLGKSPCEFSSHSIYTLPEAVTLSRCNEECEVSQSSDAWMYEKEAVKLPGSTQLVSPRSHAELNPRVAR